MSIAVLVLFICLLLVLRVPVGISLLLPSLLYLAWEPDVGMGIAVQQLMSGADTFALLAVPMFILLGSLANTGGITDRIFDFCSAMLSRVRGGLGYVNIATSFGFSWISGAAISDAAAMGKIQVPQMVKRGYSPSFSLGLTASSSLIAPMMPPSIPSIIYAVTAGVSVSSLFIVGLIPAALLALLLALYVYVVARRSGPPHDHDGEAQGEQRRISLFLKALPVLGAPVVVLGGIVGGVFTPTEASSAGVLYIFCLGLMYRSMTWSGIKTALTDAASTTASIMFIVVSASLFGWVMARERVPEALGEILLAFTTSPVVFMLLVLLFLLAIGSVLEPTAAILITVPVLAPMAPLFEVDPVHIGVVVVFTLMVGLITPPVGLVLFVLSGVSNYSVGQVMKGVAPLYVVMLAVLLSIAFIPLLF